MIESGSGAGFTLKAFASAWFLGEFFRKKLQGNAAAEALVFCLVDDAHPATAKPFDDAVVRDGLSDHWRRMLRVGSEQVNH
jgi:hypothetical protein